MAQETSITLIGNLTDDPELRFTASGQAVVNFNVASTPRTFNRNTSQWEDGETMYLRCTAWRDQAENIADTLKKGMRVILQGNLGSHSYEDREGNQRTSFQVDVQEVGPSLRWAKADVTRVSSSNNGGKNNSNSNNSNRSSAPKQDTNGWGGDEEPPF